MASFFLQRSKFEIFCFLAFVKTDFLVFFFYANLGTSSKKKRLKDTIYSSQTHEFLRILFSFYFYLLTMFRLKIEKIRSN